MKKLLAAVFVGMFALSVAPAVIAQDKGDKGKKEMKKGEDKKTDGKKKAEEKKKKS
jgi:hypothetical protein